MLKFENEKCSIQKTTELNSRSEYYNRLKDSVHSYFNLVCDLSVPNYRNNDWDNIKTVIYGYNIKYGNPLFYDYEIRRMIDYGDFIENYKYIKLSNDDFDLSVDDVLNKLSNEDYRYFKQCEETFNRYLNKFDFNYYKICWTKYLGRNFYVNYTECKDELLKQLQRLEIKNSSILTYIKTVILVYNQIRKSENRKSRILNQFSYDLKIYNNGSFDIKIYSKDFIKEQYNILLEQSDEYNVDYRKRFFEYDDVRVWGVSNDDLGMFSDKQKNDFDKQCLPTYHYKYETTQKYLVSETKNGQLKYDVEKVNNNYRLLLFEDYNIRLYRNRKIRNVDKKLILEYFLNY